MFLGGWYLVVVIRSLVFGGIWRLVFDTWHLTVGALVFGTLVLGTDVVG